ncbi:MAG: valine--tRNA ligase [bacterium]
MKKEFPKAYEPVEYEDQIYKNWEEKGFFNPDNLDLPKTAEKYSIMMPPPNVTGVLHLGHALENTIMDIEVRYQRMKGKRAVIIPGTDHAAVATQAKVEKLLMAEGIKNPREELGREELLKRIREYAENSKATIISQIKRLGTSCDWSRFAYTFDEKRSSAVNEMFIKMYNDRLIYKGYRVINWSVKGQSTCSDDELEYREEKTKLYTFKYSKDFPIFVSTTRPETKLGDVAVAVNPKDARYKRYINQTFTVDVGAKEPLNIEIIGDKEVDPEYGTGAVGVTPAHSMIDFEMKERHNLKLIKIIGEDGKMTEAAGKEYTGLDAKTARDKFVEWLRKNNLLEKEEEIVHNIGTSDRFKDVVEVIPMEQWFVAVNKKIPGKEKSLKDLMKEAVAVGHSGDKEKKIEITPDRFNNQYFHWIDNLRDWCISRQIWWGHRIPVWYCACGEVICVKEKPEKCPKCGIKELKQDPDTLDTWFSSGTWTFSTLGWPEKTEDLKNYHSSAWMQMGYEILFFWMARMILMSTYALDDIPFKNVYIHGMLRDKNGNKFSKSAGNGINPIEIIDKYGADALRLSLILGIAPGNDSKFYEEKVESGKNFVNKLWNISRYILDNLEDKIDNINKIKIDNKKLNLADRWILGKLDNLIKEVGNDLENYNFSQAGEKLREFTWNDLADWYLEASKFEKSAEKEKVLAIVLRDLLKMWHPFMPFVAEVIWKNLDKSNLIVEKWPVTLKGKFNGNDFELIKEIISSIRNARSENKIEPAKKIKAVIYAGDKTDLVKEQSELIKKLRTGIEELEIRSAGDEIADAINIAVGNIRIFLIGAVDKEKEKVRIKKDIDNLEKVINKLKNKLANQEFLDKAPKNIIERERKNLKEREEELKNLKKN